MLNSLGLRELPSVVPIGEDAEFPLVPFLYVGKH